MPPPTSDVWIGEYIDDILHLVIGKKADLITGPILEQRLFTRAQIQCAHNEAGTELSLEKASYDNFDFGLGSPGFRFIAESRGGNH